MPDHNAPALDFLLRRRSYPAKMMQGAVPDRATLTTLLTAAARSPDHGKLVPWRFLVLEKPALARLSTLAGTRGATLGLDAERIAKGVAQYGNADLIVAVVASPKPSPKVPQLEQVMSAGAVCLGLVNAALAAGWAACWLTGWPSQDRGFVEQGLGLQPEEFIAGIVHIGSETTALTERPRPDLDQITTWMTA